MIASSILSAQCLASFPAYRQEKFAELWRSALASNLSLKEFALAIPLQGRESQALITEKVKLCQAERYGGQGLGNNGGGARCGNFRGIQIKGIGKNILAGPGTDYFHSYGGMSLFEGVLECIWSEVLTHALPHGAVQSLFLIELQDKVPIRYPKKGGPIDTRRVLMGRKPVVRLAHFMRAPGFRRSHNSEANLISDVERTNSAVDILAVIGRNLRSPSDGQGGQQKSALDYSTALTYFIKRLANQIATSRTLRIMHGSITESNVGIGGEWLDFGSVSTTSGYGKLILPRNGPHFLNEERLIAQGIHDVVFYINKFAFGRKQVLAADFYEALLLKELKDQLVYAWVKLLGLTETQAYALPLQLAVEVSNAISAIALHGANRAFTILSADNDEIIRMPERMTTFDIGECLIKCANLSTQESIHIEIESHLQHPSLSKSLASAISKVHANFDQIDKDAAARSRRRAIWSFNCIRRNLKVKPLYRTNLHPAIEKLSLDRNDGATRSFINNYSKFGQTLYCNRWSMRVGGKHDVEIAMFEDTLSINGAIQQSENLINTLSAATSELTTATNKACL